MNEDSEPVPDLNPSESSSDSPKKPVKSTAVVKYSAVSSPATFAELQCNTDLNLPPSNWLSTSAEGYGLQNVWSRGSGFSGFRMAHMFPDCVGEVDVVSDAENIKKLLKLPYSHGLVSMMVHRVGNTLLLDDFDIHKYLLRQAENDWEWLKKFFYDHVFQNLGDKEKRLFPKANSRNVIQQKNLISKFLYHSLVLANNEQHNDNQPPLPVEHLQPALPEPTPEEKLPDPNFNHNFSRNVVWTFENIQMLIGTDMPIFGGQTHPCISLRLRDTTKPISVLTGIDYWLDNLMCNVPEVIMCYHLDGIVQKYELIKTEDLPNLDDAKFSPKVIRDIAQNILSFLKNNATKAGHTYWLFKGKNDDVVKLYDLTSLCHDMSEDKSQNPFTVPVAMLLYRVARNMKYSSDYTKNRGSIRMLLKNCIQLLPKEKYPQIVTSAHFMLADLYVPADTDPANLNFADLNDEDDTHSECGSTAESDRSDEQDMNAAIKSLTLTKIKEHQIKEDFEEFKFKPPPVVGAWSIEERCQTALEHVSAGIDCLKYFPTDSDDQKDATKDTEHAGEKIDKDNILYEGETMNMAKPFQAIPMPYVPLHPTTSADTAINSSVENSPSHRKKNKQKKKKQASKSSNSSSVADTSARALQCKAASQTLPTWQAPKKDDNHSWSAHLKTLLYEKASLVFAVLAENEYTNKNYGATLRYILAVLHCQKILELFCGIMNDKSVSYLLGRAGDCCFMIVQDWPNVGKHRNDYETKSVTENSITDVIFAIQDLNMMNGAEVLPDRFDSLEETLTTSYKCYEKALSLEPLEEDKKNLTRRLGNIHNELGVLFMNQAGTRYQQGEIISVDLSNCAEAGMPLIRSIMHLESGIKAFESVHDEANLALLHSNTGRLMRLCAHVNAKQCAHERGFYYKAVTSYQKALQVLGTRKTHPYIWDNVTWDMATTLVTIATELQDYPIPENRSDEEVEREIVDTFQKALKLCESETTASRQPVYQFRASTIQHRLASMYHKIYRELEHDVVRRKKSLQLSKLYYEKSAKSLHVLEQTTEFLTVQMERVALAEFQATNANAFNVKHRAYLNCLELILESRPVIEIIIERPASTNDDEKEEHKKTLANATNNAENKEREQPWENDIKDDNLDESRDLEEEENLVNLLEQRLQFVLRSLTKLFMNKSSSDQKTKHEQYAALYKKYYSLTLRSKPLSGVNLVKHIASILDKLKDVLEF